LRNQNVRPRPLKPTWKIGSLVVKQSRINGRMDQLVADWNMLARAAEQRQAAESARTEQAKLEFRLTIFPILKATSAFEGRAEAERVGPRQIGQDAAVAIAKLERQRCKFKICKFG